MYNGRTDIVFASCVLLDLRYRIRIVIVRKDEPLQPNLGLNFVDKVTPAEREAAICQLRERFYEGMGHYLPGEGRLEALVIG